MFVFSFLISEYKRHLAFFINHKHLKYDYLIFMCLEELFIQILRVKYLYITIKIKHM